MPVLVNEENLPFAEDVLERIMKARQWRICGGAINVGSRVDSRGALPHTPGFFEA